LCSVLPLIAIYLQINVHFNPFSSFKDMARTGNQYEKVNG